MRELLRDAEHLVRLAAVFVVGFLLFLAARAAFVPDDFGRYGHYRAGALDDNRARLPVFAGCGACGDCHFDVTEHRSGGAHERVGCEACHGAQYVHTQDPGAVVPERPDGATICLRCHEANDSRPAWFEQVDAEEHAMGEPCNTCHDPHRPAIE